MITPRRLVVAITGASGAVFGVRMLQALREQDAIESHLILTAGARAALALESRLHRRGGQTPCRRGPRRHEPRCADLQRLVPDAGMVVAPCSIRTLSGIATSNAVSLTVRAADVALKERRPLVLLVRETPLHLGHLRLMMQATEAGATIMPPVPAFYHRPERSVRSSTKPWDALWTSSTSTPTSSGDGTGPKADSSDWSRRLATADPSAPSSNVSGTVTYCNLVGGVGRLAVRPEEGERGEHTRRSGTRNRK